MPNSFFQFKQFTIQQDKCAMKVGTDGTLLGAWVHVSTCRTILDVGTGTGLIALMIAQRNREAIIDAIDIDSGAYTQSTENIANSPFSKQIHTHHVSFQSYANTTQKQYDLIISNPPYFANSLKCPEEKRNLARHNDTLPLTELFAISSSLLLPHGRIALVLPFQKEEESACLARQNKLFKIRQTHIIPSMGAKVKRLLVEFSFQPTLFTPEEIILEKNRNQRTDAYQKLMYDFYLQ